MESRGVFPAPVLDYRTTCPQKQDYIKEIKKNKARIDQIIENKDEKGLCEHTSKMHVCMQT